RFLRAVRSVLLALHRRRAVPPARAASRRGANRRADPHDRALDAWIVRHGRDSARREGRGWGWDRVRAQDADPPEPADRTSPTGPAGTPFAQGRVAAGRPHRTGERAGDGAGTGTRRGRKRLEGGRGSGSAGDGPNPGDRPPTGAILRSPGACSRHAYGRSAALTGE